ncbi:sulfite reductase (NADPH) flavoprotein [Actinomadura verrucosospora]|uniref:Sulfite reductase (NADPH) flavoprotein n=2 Tax=Actinomadura verrucosospora TaxID=46165 RepID=A0A7D3W0L2_ACTVE|nr:sulfite reductase (NADPH) flavoprotein [Actinomadura verrucosospora]
MVGDLTYDKGLLAEGRLPGVGSKRQMRAATQMVNRLRTRLPGLVVLPAHDPAAGERLAAALADHPEPQALADPTGDDRDL